MEFCDDCGSMMKAEEEFWVCQAADCDNRTLKDPDAEYVLTDDQEASEVIETEVGGGGSLPKTDARCPECGNDEAFWYMQQIRAADESETRFFVCTDCEHKWREDDN